MSKWTPAARAPVAIVSIGSSHGWRPRSNVPQCTGRSAPPQPLRRPRRRPRHFAHSRISMSNVRRRSFDHESREDVAQSKRLVEAAAKLDPRIHLLVLLGGSAGLRRDELMSPKWTDLDIKRRSIHVQRSIRRGAKVDEVHETVPKGGKGRKVTMTTALAEALTKHRHLRGERVLYTDDCDALTNKIVRMWFERAQRAAGLEVTGAIHRLRHAFCSMLASEGAPSGAIREARRPREHRHDDEIHAPQPDDAACGDRPPRRGVHTSLDYVAPTSTTGAPRDRDPAPSSTLPVT